MRYVLRSLSPPSQTFVMTRYTGYYIVFSPGKIHHKKASAPTLALFLHIAVSSLDRTALIMQPDVIKPDQLREAIAMSRKSAATGALRDLLWILEGEDAPVNLLRMCSPDSQKEEMLSKMPNRLGAGGWIDVCTV